MSKHPGGRPTEYKPLFINKVDEYLAECQDYAFVQKQDTEEDDDVEE